MIRSRRRASARQSWAQAVILFVTLLVMAGCGSDDNDFVVTGNNNQAPAATTGTLVFNFAKPQTVTTVPDATTNIRFRFFASADATGTPLFTETRPFATQITFTEVEPEVNSVEVTALGPNNVPLFEAIGTFDVVLGGAINVNLDAGTAITLTTITVSPGTNPSIDIGATQTFTANATYSNGDIIPAVGATWDSSNDAVATVNATTGVATGVANGDVDIIATLNGVPGDAPLNVDAGLVLTTINIGPDFSLNDGASSPALTVSGFDQFGDPIAVTGTVVFSVGATDDITVTQAGVVTADNTNNVGGTGTVTATIQGTTITDSATVTVLGVPGDLSAITAAPDPLALTFGGPTETLTSTGTFTNGPNTVLTNAADGITYTSSDLNVATVGMTTGIVTPVGVGTAIITVTDGTIVSNGVDVTVGFAPTNANPALTLTAPASTFLNRTVATPAFAAVDLVDDQAYLTGGQITIAITGGTAGLDALNVTVPALVGTVSNNGTESVTVALLGGASQTAIETLLSTLTITPDAAASFGDRTLTVTITDGQGGSDDGSINYFVRGAGGTTFTVDDSFVAPVSPQFNTIQEALDALDDVANAQFSTIVVNEGNYADTVISNDPELQGVRIEGPNANNPAGVSVSNWVGEANILLDGTDVIGFDIDNSDVQIRGFTFRVALTFNDDIAIELDDQANRVTIENNVFVASGELAPTTATGNRAIFNSDTANAPQDLHVVQNYFQNWGQALRLDARAGANMTGFLFEGNNVFNNERGLVIFEPDSSALVQGNRFSGNLLGLDDTLSSHLQGQMEGEDTLTVVGNDFIGLGAVRAFLGAGPINANGNFWGQAGGPIPGQVIEQGGGFVNTDTAADTAFFGGTLDAPPVPTP